MKAQSREESRQNGLFKFKAKAEKMKTLIILALAPRLRAGKLLGIS